MDDFEKYLRYELRRSPLTCEAYMGDLRAFSAWLAGHYGVKPSAMADASTDRIRAWLASLSRAGEAPASVRRKCTALRTFFRYQCILGHRSDNPAADITPIKLPKKLPQFVRVEEMEKIISEEHDAGDEDPPLEQYRDSLIIELLYATGMRRAELIGLSDSDISSDGRELRVTGKRNKQRVLPLPPQLSDRIRKWQQMRDQAGLGDQADSPLFATSRGRISKSTVYNIVKEELGDTHTGRKSPHTMRHTFATAMLNSGCELNDVKEFLGHSSLATTQIYTHVTLAELQSAYKSAHPRAASSSEAGKSGEGKESIRKENDNPENKNGTC